MGLLDDLIVAIFLRFSEAGSPMGGVGAVVRAFFPGLRRSTPAAKFELALKSQG